MAIARSSKYIGIKYNPGTDSPYVLIRTFNDTIEDASKVGVSFNGQRILQRTTENVSVPNSFSKYYYELTINPSNFIVSIKTNVNYVPPDYISSTVSSYDIQPDDTFYVDYTYTFTV